MISAIKRINQYLILFCLGFLILACEHKRQSEMPAWQPPQWVNNQTVSKLSESLTETSSTTGVDQNHKSHAELSNRDASLITTNQNRADVWQTLVDVDIAHVPFKTVLKNLAKIHEFDFRQSDFTTHQITYQAKQTPLYAVLEDICHQAGFVMTINQRHVHVRLDKPYWANYQLAYPNITRTSRSQANLNQQVEGQFRSNIEVETLIENQFWQRFETAKQQIANIHDAEIIINQDASLISVHGKQEVHQQLAKLINDIDRQVGQQLFIEMAIVEVELNDEFQSGIDWSLLDESGVVNFSQQSLGASINSPPRTVLTATGIFEGISLNFGARIMNQFGKSRLLSSPQIRAINNQTAVLKVVDNLIYYIVGTRTVERNNDSITTFETEPRSLAVGLVVSLTPHIEENGEVILNIRPTLSRVIDYVNDPNPDLAKNDVVSRVPIVQVREMESVLKVNAGEVAIIGGLMQKRAIESTAKTVTFGFNSSQATQQVNTELVIFVRTSLL